MPLKRDPVGMGASFRGEKEGDKITSRKEGRRVAGAIGGFEKKSGFSRQTVIKKERASCTSEGGGGKKGDPVKTKRKRQSLSFLSWWKRGEGLLSSKPSRMKKKSHN